MHSAKEIPNRYRISSHTMLPILLLVACLVFSLLVWLDQRPGQTQTDGFQINQLTAIHQTTISSRPTGFVELNGMVYFGLDKYRSYDRYDKLSGLWRTDGTAEGTVMVKDILWDPLTLQRVGDKLYFKTYSAQLWQSDGTVEGTELLRDIFPGTASSNPDRFTAGNGYFLFTAYNETLGRELWQSDGTTAHTQLVVDLYPGRASGDIAILGRQDDILLFTGDNGHDGKQLFSLVTFTPRSLPPAEEPTIPDKTGPDEEAEQIFLPHVNR